MRIGMVLDAVFPPDPRVENEAISLIDKGHEVFLFCLKYDATEQDEIVNGIQVKRYLTNKLEYKLSALAYTVPFYTIFMQKKITDFIKVNTVEALHVHDIRIAQAVFNVNKKYQLPVILDLHENRPEIMKYYPHLSTFPGKYLISPKKWKQKEEEFIFKATKIVVVTPEANAEIKKRVDVNSSKIIDVPNTVRKDFYTEIQVDEKIVDTYANNFVLLYIGDTGLRRGLITAIEAIPILKNKIKNLKLVIVGRNSTDTLLKSLVKGLNLETYVDFLGWKAPSLFQSYIFASDVCISPLHRNIHHDTTYANKIFQYMSLGKPVLGSDAIAQKKMIEKANSGLVHLAKDSNDFATKVVTLYKNKTLRKTLGENGKKFIENKFTWEKTSKKLIDLYDNL